MEPKVKLSREDLLAGKCFPENLGGEASDPRFKSPDELLTALARQHEHNSNLDVIPETIIEPILEPFIENQDESTTTQETQITLSAYEVKITQQTTTTERIEQLKSYYETELQRWQDYAKKVQDWFKDVSKTVLLANEKLLLSHNMEGENELLRRELKLREEELQELKQKLASQKPPQQTKPPHTFSIQDII